MELWGEQENRYKEQRIDPYLSSHELSDTYLKREVGKLYEEIIRYKICT